MGIRIEPSEWYTEEALRIAGFDGPGLSKARKRGDLRGKKVGNAWHYKGEWLLQWLENTEPVGAKS